LIYSISLLINRELSILESGEIPTLSKQKVDESEKRCLKRDKKEDKNMKKFGKKGFGFNDLTAVAMMFVLVGVMLGIGAYINSQIQSTAGWAATSTAYLAVANSTQGIATLSSWLPIIAIVIAAGVVITVLVSAFAFKREGV
jgi:hypothetical protein